MILRLVMVRCLCRSRTANRYIWLVSTLGAASCSKKSVNLATPILSFLCTFGEKKQSAAIMRR